MSPLVTIVILNWKQAEATVACLQSVSEQNYANLDTVVIDNGSGDGSVEVIRQAFPQVRLIANDKNLGFAMGVNQGIGAALENGADYVCLLNNDALLEPNGITELVAEAVSAENIGAVTATIYYEDERNRIWHIGGYERRWLLEIDHIGRGEIDAGQLDAVETIDFAPMCCLLISRAVFETVGLLDEGFFVYYEDMDFARRVREAGFEMRLAHNAIVWHGVSLSSGGSGSSAERYWMALASGRYFRKHARWFQYPLIVPYRLASAVRTTGRLTGQRRFKAVVAYWLGLSRGWLTGNATQQPPQWLVR